MSSNLFVVIINKFLCPGGNGGALSSDLTTVFNRFFYEFVFAKLYTFELDIFPLKLLYLSLADRKQHK